VIEVGGRLVPVLRPRLVRVVLTSSVSQVAIFHAGVDASISQLPREVVPASNGVRFLIFRAVIVVAATAVIIAIKGQLGRRVRRS
jgi:hypothetical protein